MRRSERLKQIKRHAPPSPSPADAAPTRHAARPRRTESTAASACGGDLLFTAMDTGALLPFLTLEEAVNVLNSNHWLRHDQSVSLRALTAKTPMELPHLKQLMVARPAYLQSRDALCGEADVENEQEEEGAPWLEALVFDKPTARRAQLLSLLGALSTKLMPLCFKLHSTSPFDDVATLRPVLIPMDLPEPMANPRAEGGTIGENSTWWLKEDVKRAVGQALDDEDCGRDFVADVQDYVHVSELGAHWETLQTCKGRVSCNLCDTARWSIQQYRKEAKEMLKKFNEALKVKRAKWRSQGKDEDEMHQLRSEMKTQWFPDDSFPDINFADGTDDDILADICESGKFPLNPFCGMAAGFVHGDDDIFNALSAQLTSACPELLQQLYAELSQRTVFIGRRLQRSWMCSDQAWIKGELIAGITRSGFLYGVFLVVHRPDY